MSKKETEQRLKVITKLSNEIDQLLDDRLSYIAALGDPFYIAMRALVWSLGDLIGQMHRDSPEDDMDTYCRLVASILMDEAKRSRTKEQELKEENDKLRKIVRDKIDEFEAAIIGKPEAQA